MVADLGPEEKSVEELLEEIRENIFVIGAKKTELVPTMAKILTLLNRTFEPMDH